jgi:trimethylamine:corrinoid methyltransferase-like protein
VKLCNNWLTSIGGLAPALAPFLLMQQATSLQWLDLSCNRLAKIDAAAIDALPNIGILYLHANRLDHFRDVGTKARTRRRRRRRCNWFWLARGSTTCVHAG